MAGYCEKVAALQDRRAGLYHALEEALLRSVGHVLYYILRWVGRIYSVGLFLNLDLIQAES